ncbi:hypothetical protein QR680_000678 [Steinernema hermaphroditum]|uniref:Uncharacterized protein n=1 Tax=Steinernema hermaphroditum TaxID=289476 RepID=A0AA39GWA7_9BILA|nr:hypothetical protein QR680_000678 [Steinernema hermaphroditum]
MLETLFRSRCVIQHLYGPFWISVALIVTTGILGNLSKYIKSSGAADQTLLSVTTMCIRIQSYNNCSSFDSFGCSLELI